MVLGTIFYFLRKTPSQIVKIDLYGASTDPAMIQIENNLLALKEKFGSKVELGLHYIAI